MLHKALKRPGVPNSHSEILLDIKRKGRKLRKLRKLRKMETGTPNYVALKWGNEIFQYFSNEILPQSLREGFLFLDFATVTEICSDATILSNGIIETETFTYLKGKEFVVNKWAYDKNIELYTMLWPKRIKFGKKKPAKKFFKKISTLVDSFIHVNTILAGKSVLYRAYKIIEEGINNKVYSDKKFMEKLTSTRNEIKTLVDNLYENILLKCVKALRMDKFTIKKNESLLDLKTRLEEATNWSEIPEDVYEDLELWYEEYKLF